MVPVANLQPHTWLTRLHHGKCVPFQRFLAQTKISPHKARALKRALTDSQLYKSQSEVEAGHYRLFPVHYDPPFDEPDRHPEVVPRVIQRLQLYRMAPYIKTCLTCWLYIGFKNNCGCNPQSCSTNQFSMIDRGHVSSLETQSWVPSAAARERPITLHGR